MQIYDQGNAFIDDYIKNPEGVLSEQAKSLLSDYRVTDTCQNLGYSGDLVRGCEATFLSQLASVEYGNKLENQLRQDNQTMTDLIEQVKNAKDTKATQDATNAVALEQLKFEKLKFQYQMYIDKQKQLSEYKKEMAKASFRHEQINAKPIDYREAFSTQDFDLIK